MPYQDQLRCHIDQAEECTIVRADGVLGTATYATLRDTLLKCAVEQPKALIVDLSDVTIAASTALSLFTTVSIRISDWPAVPIIVASGPHNAELLRRSPIRRYVRVYGDVTTALANIDQPPPSRRAFFALPNILTSPRAARQFVRDTCSHWNLPAVVTQDAVQVASELVQNTIQHTLSEARLRLELRHRLLTVAVADDNPVPVVIRDPGSDIENAATGILLVAQLTKSWGCVTDPVMSHKTVWAVLDSFTRLGSGDS
jgi:anti-anti-sigma regulatory factor